MTVSMEIEPELESRVQDLFSFDCEKTATDVICQALSFEKFPYEAEINLLLTGDEGIRQMNRDYRQTDRPTDVLSFPMIHYDTPGDFSHLEDDADNFNPDTGEAVLGDIIINVNRAVQQAQEYGHSRLREFAFLIAHSMMHLFGYDHMTPQEAAVMELKQEQVLEKLHILRDF